MVDNISLTDHSGAAFVSAANDIAGVLHQRVKLQQGAAGEATDISQGEPLAVDDVGHLIARGLVTGRSAGILAARNPDIDAGTEDVWPEGGTMTPPTAARLHDLVSGSANDDLAGTGAEIVRVYGVDGSDELADESVTMDGTSSVSTVGLYKHVYAIEVTQAGSGGVNAGKITATAQTDATVTCAMQAGTNKAAGSHYLVPTDYDLQIESLWGHVMGSGSTSGVIFELWEKASASEPWRVLLTWGGQANGAGGKAPDLSRPLVFVEGTWIKITGTSGGADADVSAGFEYTLVSNPS